jgi:hypothetical protein
VSSVVRARWPNGAAWFFFSSPGGFFVADFLFLTIAFSLR